MKRTAQSIATIFCCLLLLCACSFKSVNTSSAISQADDEVSPALLVPPEETLNLVSDGAIKHTESGAMDYQLSDARIQFYQEIFDVAAENDPSKWYDILDTLLPFQNYAVELANETKGSKNIDAFFENFYHDVPDTLYLIAPADPALCYIRKYSYDGNELMMQQITSNRVDYVSVYYFDRVQLIDDFYYCSLGGVSIDQQIVSWMPDGKTKRTFALSQYNKVYPRPDRIGLKGNNISAH